MSNQVITFPATRREAKARTTPDVTTFKMPADLGGFAIRVIEIDSKPWFVAADVCRALGRGNPSMALAPLDSDQKGSTTCATPGGDQRMAVVSESGLYLLVMRAQRQGRAKEFQDWVTREVLPAIRKDGGYIMGEEKLRTGEMSEDEFIARALLMTHSKFGRVTAERDQLASRDAVLEHLRGFVTVDAYCGEENHIDGRYKTWQEKVAIGRKAADLCRERGIPIQKEHRTMRTKGWGIINTRSTSTSGRCWPKPARCWDTSSGIHLLAN